MKLSELAAQQRAKTEAAEMEAAQLKPNGLKLYVLHEEDGWTREWSEQWGRANRGKLWILVSTMKFTTTREVIRVPYPRIDA